MKITKTQGALISFAFISFYCLMYYEWVKDLNYSFKLTLLFFVGIFFHFLRKIKPGTVAELLFRGKALGHYWDDGFCLVPSLLPVLHNIGIYLLWDLKKDNGILRPDFNPNVSVQHYADQRAPVYKINADASLFALSVHNFFGKLFDWIMFPFSDTSELKFQRLGFRIVLLALIAGAAGNAITSTRNFVKDNNPFQGPATEILLISNLNDNESHPFPAKEMFTEVDVSRSPSEVVINEVRYLYYPKVTPGGIPQITVDSKLCSIVPVGKKIRFITAYAPRYAVNMKNSVIYIKKLEKLSFLENITLLTVEEKRYYTSDTWKTVRDYWSTIETNAWLVAEAIESNEIPDKNAGGGLVCF